jgi:RNase P subunit RPR2
MPKVGGVIRLMCPNLKCRAVLAVPPESRGRLVRCKSCGSSIRVPLKRETPGAGDTPTAPKEVVE